MKECPFCQELNRDDEIQCRYCGEWLDEAPSPRQKKQPEKKSADEQVNIQDVWKKYGVFIVVIIIVVIGILLNFKKKTDDHVSTRPVVKVVSPSAPTPQVNPVPVPPSSPADELIKKAQSLCSSGLKCPQEAIDYLTDAIRLESDNRNAYLIRGGAYYNMGQYTQAIEDYSNAIRLEPDNAHTYALRGFSYGNMGQYQSAIADFDEAIRLKPDKASYYRGRGHIYIYANKIEDACLSFAKACELGDCEQYQKYKQQGRCK